MSQIARPETEIQGGHNENGGTDKAVILSDQSDSSFLSSSSVTDTVCTLENLTDPGGNTGYILHWRSSGGSGTGAGNLTLYQGLPPSAGGSGTAIANDTLSIAASPTDFSLTLTSGEADSITDFTDLYIEYEKTGGTASRSLYEVWFEIPNAAQTETYGVAIETDAANPFVGLKPAQYGVAPETDVALAFVHSKLASYGIATESDLALPFAEIINFGTAQEVDSALAFVASKAKLGEYLGALETDTALPFVAHKHPGGGAYFPTGSVHSPFMLKPPSPRRRRNR